MIGSRILCAFGLAAICVATQATAQDSKRERLGWGQLFTNDYLGDGKDRWRTSSYQIGEVRGYSWDGVRPSAIGDLLEYRLGLQIISPEDLSKSNKDDRPYAGLLSFGVHTHFNRAGVDYSLGMDLYASGPQTQLGNFQSEIHDALGVQAPVSGILDDQIGNNIYPTLVLEAGRKYRLRDNLTIRPFAETQLGLETFGRLGADVMIGQIGHDALLVRDATTGHLLRAAKTGITGYGFLLGGDMTYVTDSQLMPNGSVEANDTRSRLRAGWQWQGERAGLFYGATWLSEEFEGQSSDQVTGSIRLQLNF